MKRFTAKCDERRGGKWRLWDTTKESWIGSTTWSEKTAKKKAAAMNELGPLYDSINGLISRK